MSSKPKDTATDKDTPAIDFDTLKEFTKASFLQALEKVYFSLYSTKRHLEINY